MRTFRLVRACAAFLVASSIPGVVHLASAQPERPMQPARPAQPVLPPGVRPVVGVLETAPAVHESTEAEFGVCPVTFHYGFRVADNIVDLTDPDHEDLGRVFPEWWEVGRTPRTGGWMDTAPASSVAILEGTVASETWTPEEHTVIHEHRGSKEFTPHVTYDDISGSHFTHDLNVHVQPDATPDNRYANLRGIQITHQWQDPCAVLRQRLLNAQTLGATGPGSYQLVSLIKQQLAKPECKPVKLPDKRKQQGLIEVEWESGLGADNDGNPCAAANRRGDSCGFASAGHKRGQELWSFPTEGDHVHIEGMWIWDRGHPPAKTEIHPPRLMVIQRKLPDLVTVAHAIFASSYNLIATRTDILANGDGNAFVNNTKGPYDSQYAVRRVPMSDRDYTFLVEHTIARPTATAPLKWTIAKHDGDSFPADATVTAYPNGTPEKPQPHVMVTIPWKSANAPDTAVFARTLHLFWDDAASLGVAAGGRPRIFNVTLDALQVNNPQDGLQTVTPGTAGTPPTATFRPGQWRVFAEVGGHWLFLNDLFGDDVLRDGLGNTRNRSWPLNRKFTVYVPPQGRFRVYAGGWDADGVNRGFGHLANPNSRCNDALREKAVDFLKMIKDNNGFDDPIGEVALAFVPAAGRIQGYSLTRAGEGDYASDPLGGDTDPNGDFSLKFHVDELPWPPPQPAGPVVHP